MSIVKSLSLGFLFGIFASISGNLRSSLFNWSKASSFQAFRGFRAWLTRSGAKEPMIWVLRHSFESCTDVSNGVPAESKLASYSVSRQSKTSRDPRSQTT